MSIKSGRYIITNTEYWNFVFLSDNSDGTSLQACLKEDVPGQEWNVSEHGKGRYSIVNFGHKMWASAGFRPEKGEHVVGRERVRVWLIKKHDSTGNYTIATADDKLRWWLDDSEPETPIMLHSAPPSDPRCHWNFQRIGHLDPAHYEAAEEEEAVVVKAELARKTRELEVARGEVAQAKAVAADNATRWKDAEAETSRKAAEVEAAKQEVARISEELQEAKQEAALAKAEVVTTFAELQEARREAAAARVEVEKTARKAEVAKARAEDARRDLADEATKREAAEAEVAKKAEEVKEAEKEATQAKAEMIGILAELEAARQESLAAKGVSARDAAKRKDAELEVSRKAAELEQAKRELAQSEAEAVQDAVRSEEAEAEASRKAAGFEEAKKEAPGAKAEVARRSKKVKGLKKAVAHAKEEMVSEGGEQEPANKRLKALEPAETVDLEAAKNALQVQDPLAGLADAKPCKEINLIVEGALHSFHILNPWRGITTRHPQLRDVIQMIKSYTVIYSGAIDTSINTAQDGYGFGNEAVEQCNFVLDPETDPGDLREYILDLQNKAKHVRWHSSRTLNKFREARKALIKITEMVPIEALVRPEFSIFNYSIQRYTELYLDSTASIYTAMKELNLAALNLRVLADNVDKFAEWWSGMETVITKAESNGSDLRAGKDKLRVKVIQKSWEGIRDECDHYKVQIIQLQDHYHQEHS